MNSIENYEALMRVDEREFKKALNMARNIGWKNFGKRIRFYAPSFIYYKTGYFHSSPTAFPSISVTGSSCALKCKHCDGRVLNTMFPALTSKELVDLCVKLRNKGAIGCLISGGCLPDGSVPLSRFVDAIAKIKRDLGLTIVVHTGVINLSTARRLKEAGVDAALIDVIGSDETIREVYQLKVNVEDYDKSLRALHESEIPLVPHVLVGLHYGKLKGELQALKIISKYSPSAVIVIAFMPIHGTPMEKVNPPAPEDIARVLATARLMMPQTPIVLGCMRPKGEHKKKTDMLAVKAGVNAIAFPAEEAVQLAESLGLEVTFSSLCCSQIFEDIKLGI
ncbi:MAG: radical SAM protein [Candidatus Bathyarchaeia archaeon]